VAFFGVVDAVVCGNRFGLAESNFISPLVSMVGGGGEDFTDAAQCDAYLLQNTIGCVYKIKIRKSVMQGRKEWCCPSVSDSEVSLGSLHNRKVQQQHCRSLSVLSTLPYVL
jgi:hypothetical protein